jgi:hypothetical protein
MSIGEARLIISIDIFVPTPKVAKVIKAAYLMLTMRKLHLNQIFLC